jgi:hypothetical protein
LVQQLYRDERTLMFVMEAFIAANRALVSGMEEALEAAKALPAHYCPGEDCPVHNAAILRPLRDAFDDNTRLGDFITEVVAQTRRA